MKNIWSVWTVVNSFRRFHTVNLGHKHILRLFFYSVPVVCVCVNSFGWNRKNDNSNNGTRRVSKSYVVKAVRKLVFVVFDPLRENRWKAFVAIERKTPTRREYDDNADRRAASSLEYSHKLSTRFYRWQMPTVKYGWVYQPSRRRKSESERQRYGPPNERETENESLHDVCTYIYECMYVGLSADTLMSFSIAGAAMMAGNGCYKF